MMHQQKLFTIFDILKMNWRVQCTKKCYFNVTNTMYSYIYNLNKYQNKYQYITCTDTHCCSSDLKNYSFINWSTLSENKFNPTLLHKSHIYTPDILFVDYRLHVLQYSWCLQIQISLNNWDIIKLLICTKPCV